MVYQTQETQAKEVIERLKNAGAESVCLWLHTSQLHPDNKNPNKMNMIAHLLKPLTDTTVCRLFFLHGGDILIIGTPDIRQKSDAYIDRIRRVLSTDAFVQSVGSDFMTTYCVLLHADLLLSALTSAKNDLPAQDITTVWPQVSEKANGVSVSDVMTNDVVLGLTPTAKQTICRLYFPDKNKLAGHLNMPLFSLTGQVWAECIRMIWKRNTDLFRHYNENPLPAFIYFNVSDITTSGFDLFMQNRTGKTIVCLSAEEILTNPNAFSAFKKLHANRVEWALIFTHGDNLSLIDFSKIKPNYICVPFFDGLTEQLPEKIHKNTVIITGLKSDKDLLDLLRNGFSYFQGPVVNLILGASCQQKCPYGDTCTDGLCQRIWTGKINQHQCVFPDFRNRFILDEQEGA